MKYSKLTLVLPFIFAANVSAQDITKCLSLSEPSARLACFDVAHKTPESIRFPHNKKLTAISETKSQDNKSSLTPQERFGLNQVEINAAKSETNQDLKIISSNIKSAELTRSGRTLVKLENDQVWLQASSDNVKMLPSRLKRQTSVVLKRGLFNSYTMKILPWGRSMKVKRIS